jgi:hypothetical protein
MMPVTTAGNILGEATTASGNIFNEAMRGTRLRRSTCGGDCPTECASAGRLIPLNTRCSMTSPAYA